jgi:hypothetical protein
MSFITSNPNKFILNLPAFQNVQTSATGTSGVANLFDTTNYSLKINSINTFGDATYLTIGKNTNFSNANIYMNEVLTLTPNSINGVDYLAFQTNQSEIGRFADGGLGIGTTSPSNPLHVVGNALVTGSLQVGSTVYPSDKKLKENIQPYVVSQLPEPVSFTWKATGKRDIGVLANDLQAIEPLCVQSNDGVLGVDYPKLVVLCLAELRELRAKVETLEQTVTQLQKANSV